MSGILDRVSYINLWHVGDIEQARKNNPLFVFRRAFPGRGESVKLTNGISMLVDILCGRPSRIQGITYGSKIADSFVV